MSNPFRYFKTSPEIIRLAVMMYVRYPLSLRQVEDLLHERGVDISYETVRAWWNRFGPIFAAEFRKRRLHHRLFSSWRWHLDEVFVRINGETHYLWRAVDHEGEVLESYVTKRRDRKAALRFLRKTMKRYGRPEVIVTDKLRSTEPTERKDLNLRQFPDTSNKFPVLSFEFPVPRFREFDRNRLTTRGNSKRTSAHSLLFRIISL
jgi:putative transposase